MQGARIHVIMSFAGFQLAYCQQTMQAGIRFQLVNIRITEMFSMSHDL